MKCINCDSKKILCRKDDFVCTNCKHVYPKEYWFISHSHLDIEKVRIVRNVIEEVFFYEPILFFLKCLSDEDEINGLLRREIDARIWFVYCDSLNARNSQYVQNERAYIEYLIKKGYSKKVIYIDLDKFEIWQKGCKKYIRDQVFKSLRKDKIFLTPTCSPGIVQMLYEDLTSRSYKTFYQRMITSDFSQSVDSAISKFAGEDGLILVPIDLQTLNKEREMREGRRDVGVAIDAGASVLPILFVDNEGEAQFMESVIRESMPQLANRNYVTFYKKDWQSSFARLERMLKFFYA